LRTIVEDSGRERQGIAGELAARFFTRFDRPEG